MDKFMEIMKAQMTLLEGKEPRLRISYPGTNKREMIKEAIKRLEEELKQMDEFPEDYVEKDENPKFQLSIDLFKINYDPLGLDKTL